MTMSRTSLTSGVGEGTRESHYAYLPAVRAAAGVTTATCAEAMLRYHDDLVTRGGNLTNDQETANQTGTVRNCTQAMWLNEVQPDVGSDINSDIVVSPTSTDEVLATFCNGKEAAPACR